MKIAERFKVTYLLSNHYAPAGGQPKKINHYLTTVNKKPLFYLQIITRCGAN